MVWVYLLCRPQACRLVVAGASPVQLLLLQASSLVAGVQQKLELLGLAVQSCFVSTGSFELACTASHSVSVEYCC